MVFVCRMTLTNWPQDVDMSNSGEPPHPRVDYDRHPSTPWLFVSFGRYVLAQAFVSLTSSLARLVCTFVGAACELTKKARVISSSAGILPPRGNRDCRPGSLSILLVFFGVVFVRKLYISSMLLGCASVSRRVNTIVPWCDEGFICDEV